MQGYVTLQQKYDVSPLSGYNTYVKGGFVAELAPALIKVHAAWDKLSPFASGLCVNISV